jgi:hypothetical protein
MRWADLETMKGAINSGGASGHFLWFLSIIFAVVGVVSDAANVKLGITATSWLLLAVVASAMSASAFIGWAVSWYLKTAA